ncbi:CCA tRNA nucleotidyltransferase [Cognatishimia activa]|uniref:CCA tRNA nucleotidyltransferase n=1 Tax=Cognatishimia activa TaxID=1715691 RepID=A0A975ESL8_9RHOB|nr:CCA tRNA nucleotidyltransferase [Cognatishimia activa]QTN37072.1 CCA tRNA nucleotidyltransferase [Cognatishimia activa]
MKISGDWLTRAQTQAVFAMLSDAGYQVYAVGGCVRNALMGVAVSDVDMSTDATPDQVVQLAKTAGLKAIPTGIDHGTITVVSGGIPHEITTFRKDVATDGRRATVAFSTNVRDDARRRDFTMNALYVGRDGEVLDPLGGMADLEARILRFIDNPKLRIREDYLRILRYFRFHAWYGDPAAGMDPAALAAIAETFEGLAQISKERIGSELIKLLAATDPAPSVAAMRQTGVLGQVLPGAEDRALAPLVHLEGEAGLAPDALRRLASLGGDGFSERLRLSKKQTETLGILREETGSMEALAAVAYRRGADVAYSVALLRAAVFETPLHPEMRTDIALGAGAEFPVKAADLMPEFEGENLGEALKTLEASWIASGFTLSKDDLLRSL